MEKPCLGKSAMVNIYCSHPNTIKHIKHLYNLIQKMMIIILYLLVYIYQVYLLVHIISTLVLANGAVFHKRRRRRIKKNSRRHKRAFKVVRLFHTMIFFVMIFTCYFSCWHSREGMFKGFIQKYDIKLWQRIIFPLYSSFMR